VQQRRVDVGVIELRVASTHLVHEDAQQQGSDIVHRPDRRDVPQPRAVGLIERRHLANPLHHILACSQRPAVLGLVLIDVVDQALVNLIEASLEVGLGIMEKA